MLKAINLKKIDIYCQKEDVDHSIRKLIENLLFPVAKKQGFKYVSEKTPLNVVYFAEILEIFPDAKCIFVVRSPRAIINSLLQVGKRAQEKGIQVNTSYVSNVKEAIDLVYDCFQKGLKALNVYPDKIYLIHYEKLALQPQKETELLCNFLKIDFEETMINCNKNEQFENYVVDGIWYTENMYNAAIDSSKLFDWVNFLNPEENFLILKKFKNNKELESLGYNLQESLNEISDLLFELSVKNISNNDFVNAEKNLINMSAIDTRNNVLLNLGKVQYQLGKYKEAITSLEKSLKSNKAQEQDERINLLIKCLENIGDIRTAKLFSKKYNI